jgi:DNA-directed RNA polymerase specialized sigma24 family protein
VRHGGGLEKVSSDAALLEVAAPAADEELLLLHEALDALATHDLRKAELVKMNYFIGLSLEESAQVLGISTRTAERDWAYSRAWLFNEIERLKG